MRNKRPLVLLLLACCLAQPALGVAQPASGVTIFGRPDCGVWLSKQRETDKAWLLGYVSGISTNSISFYLIGLQLISNHFINDSLRIRQRLLE
jgi:hypothetical protein